MVSNYQFQENLVKSPSGMVIVDKGSYFPGEMVKIVIKNDYDELIHIGSFRVSSIYKKYGEDWVLLEAYCHYPYCVYKLMAHKLESGKSMDFEWNPIQYIQTYSKSLDSGEYIISTEFRLDSENNWREAYSQQFVIQEKKP